MNDINNNNYPAEYSEEDLSPEEHSHNYYGYWSAIKAFHESKCSKRVPQSAYIAYSLYLDYYQMDINIEKIMNVLTNVDVPKKRKRNAMDYDIVFVWDIEEITMLKQSYIEEFAHVYPVLELHSFSRLIKKILEKQRFSILDEILESDVVNIENAVDDGTAEMKRLAPKYALLEQFYDEISNGMIEDGPIINYELLEKCEMSDEASDLYIKADMLQNLLCDRWKSAKQSLELVNKRSAETSKKFTNVVISDEGVGSGAAQLLVSGHSKQIPIENIYSTFKASKESVYKRIRRKFGKNCILMSVTSDHKTIEMAKKLNGLYWCVNSNESVRQLYTAQRDKFLYQ